MTKTRKVVIGVGLFWAIAIVNQVIIEHAKSTATEDETPAAASVPATAPSTGSNDAVQGPAPASTPGYAMPAPQAYPYPQSDPSAFATGPAMPTMPAMPGMPTMDPNGAPPMDMSALIARQADLERLGNEAAQNAASTYLQWVTDYRQRTGDYTTQFNPVSRESLQASVAGAQAATQRAIAAGGAGSAARATATEGVSRAIAGQVDVYNPSTGSWQRMNSGPTQFYLDQYGRIQGTNSATLPNGATPLQTR